MNRYKPSPEGEGGREAPGEGAVSIIFTEYIPSPELIAPDVLTGRPERRKSHALTCAFYVHLPWGGVAQLVRAAES